MSTRHAADGGCSWLLHLGSSFRRSREGLLHLCTRNICVTLVFSSSLLCPSLVYFEVGAAGRTVPVVREQGRRAQLLATSSILCVWVSLRFESTFGVCDAGD